MAPVSRFLALVGAALGLLCVSSFPAAAGEAPTAAQVGQAIALRRARVAEFQVIKEAAEELGIRVWLFGGTAAGFAHYVRSDLAREGGDERYRQSFFDYDLTNIYRSTQDADLVVDGSPERAEALESLIRQKMAFLQGSKEHWEVRLLRHARTVGNQVKVPLLDNPDFLEQNTDSNSTGMIELTDPPAGEGVVRDLRDWESPTPFFLQDVTRGRLHYYLSPTHQETSRYRSGDNPPLFSVIRFLVKAFQYDLAIDGEDLATVQAIIEDFDPKRDYAGLSPWAKGWLERYGPNLIRHSVDVEYAWETLERLGLRQKLISLSDPSQVGTLGWWLSREPLRTRPVGEGTGRTAAELGFEIVAHETIDFLAYESITRDITLKPNVLISRPGHPGENAASGPGFYTQPGRTGARGTGLTIRFRVDPQAREGTDFKVRDGYLLFSNRAALQVIPESLDLSILEYFHMLAGEGGQVDPSDRGAWMKLKRRLALRSGALSGGEEAELLSIVSQAVEKIEQSIGGAFPAPALAVVEDWLALPAALGHPEILDRLFARKPFAVHLVRNVLTQPGWEQHPELVRDLLLRRRKMSGEVALYVLSRPQWRIHPQLAQEVIERTNREAIPDIAWVLAQPHWKGHPELVIALMRRVSRGEIGKMYRQIYRSAALDCRASGARNPSPSCLAQESEVVALPSWKQWRDDPTLRALCGGKRPSFARVQDALREEAAAQALALDGELHGLSGAGSEACP